MHRSPLRWVVPIALTLWAAIAGGSDREPSVAVEIARRQPIVAGRAAGGIHLGDSEEWVRTVLGGPPSRVEAAVPGRRDLVYVTHSSSEAWTLTVRVTFLDAGGVRAVYLLMARHPARPRAYLGATERGYVPGESAEVLRARYGAPDATLRLPGRARPAWWYRERGLIVVPDEEPAGDRVETALVVVEPHLAADEVARMVGGH